MSYQNGVKKQVPETFTDFGTPTVDYTDPNAPVISLPYNQEGGTTQIVLIPLDLPTPASAITTFDVALNSPSAGVLEVTVSGIYIDDNGSSVPFTDTATVSIAVSPWNNADGSAADQSSTDVNYVEGNVGIGTPTPDVLLHVAGGSTDNQSWNTPSPNEMVKAENLVGGAVVSQIKTFGNNGPLQSNFAIAPRLTNAYQNGSDEGVFIWDLIGGNFIAPIVRFDFDTGYMHFAPNDGGAFTANQIMFGVGVTFNPDTKYTFGSGQIRATDYGNGVFDSTAITRILGAEADGKVAEITPGNLVTDNETVTSIATPTVDYTDPLNPIVTLDYTNEDRSQNPVNFTLNLPAPVSTVNSITLLESNPNELTVQIVYTDDNGDSQTITSTTPIDLSDLESPWNNTDGSVADQSSTDIEYDGNVSLTNLSETTDKKYFTAIDEITGKLSKQALPTVSGVASTVENKLLVKAGNAGKSVAAIVFEPWTGSTIVPTIATPNDSDSANTMIIPLSDSGGIWVNGIFVGNVVKGQTEWLQLDLGDTLYVTGGFTGGTMVSNDAWAPIYHTGFGGKEFSLYVFRSATAGSPAKLGILIGDQESEVILQDWNGNIIYQQTHDPFEVFNIDLDNGGNTATQREYRLTSSADVTVGKMHGSASPIDVSIVFPALAEPLIGHMRNGDVTSFDDLAGNLDVFMRDGLVGTGTVSFGNPFDVNGFGADQRLAADGVGIIYPQNKIACYSGADADGGELVPFTPLSWLPNMVGFPRHNGLDRISISSRFEGNLYYYDDTNTLIYTQVIARTNTTDQRHPAGVSILSNNAVFGGLRPSYVIADMPIDVKLNLAEPDRSGPTSTDTNDTEETIMHGISTDGFIRPKFNPALNEWQVFNTTTNTWVRG